MNRWILIALIPALLEPTLPGQTHTCPTSRPASDVDPAAMAILQRLERAGQAYQALKADVNYNVQQRLTGDEETRTGWVAFQRGGDDRPDKFRVSFKTLQLGGGPKTNNPVDYIFDGKWLTVAKHKIKTMTRYQVAAEGQKVEALKIGKGPFPLPFGQKAEDVTAYLSASTRPTRAGEPDGTDYLKLLPRRGQEDAVNFTRLEIWVDRTSNLPVKIRTRDQSKNVTTVTFHDIQTQADLNEEWFTMDKPLGWELNVEPLKH
jgi:outer membrane lipoprotein-sorting protein